MTRDVGQRVAWYVGQWVARRAGGDLAQHVAWYAAWYAVSSMFIAKGLDGGVGAFLCGLPR